MDHNKEQKTEVVLEGGFKLYNAVFKSKEYDVVIMVKILFASQNDEQAIKTSLKMEAEKKQEYTEEGDSIELFDVEKITVNADSGHSVEHIWEDGEYHYITCLDPIGYRKDPNTGKDLSECDWFIASLRRDK
jgi:hypothetical protein